MKRCLSLIAVTLLLGCILCSCGGAPATENTVITGATTTGSPSVDVDLTKLSSTMVYSEVKNMMTTPAAYTGKTVRMSGTFSVYHDNNTGVDFFAVLIADATACCQQGLEFVLKGDHTYPDDYPEKGAEVTVSGTFGTYQDGSYTYCRLSDAVFE